MYCSQVKLVGGRYFIEEDTGSNRARDDEEIEEESDDYNIQGNGHENMEEVSKQKRNKRLVRPLGVYQLLILVL